MELMQRQTDLLQIVLALSSASSCASVLYGRQQDGNQNSYDGDHYEKFDQSKTSSENLGRAAVAAGILMGSHAGRILSEK